MKYSKIQKSHAILAFKILKAFNLYKKFEVQQYPKTLTKSINYMVFYD